MDHVLVLVGEEMRVLGSLYIGDGGGGLSVGWFRVIVWILVLLNESCTDDWSPLSSCSIWSEITV